MKKYKLLFLLHILLIIIITVNVCTAAISKIDAFNDVYHQIITDDQTITKENQIKPNLDIFKVLYHIDEDSVILSIAVNGSIQNKESIHYIAWYNTTNASYHLKYSNGQNTGWAIDLDTNEKFYEINPPELTEHTITVFYDIINENTKAIDLWGYSLEINETDSETNLWFDYVPDSQTPPDIDSTIQENNTSDNNQTNSNGSEKNNNTNQTPGFGILLVIAASFFIITIINKKHR